MKREQLSKIRAQSAERQENRLTSYANLPEVFDLRIDGVTVDRASSLATLERDRRNLGMFKPIEVWRINMIAGTQSRVATWPAKQRHPEAVAVIRIRDGALRANVSF